MATAFRIGDRVSDGAIAGTVVCLIGEGQFTADYPESEWGYLQSGLLVLTSEAGLVHFPEADSLYAVE